MPFPFYSLVISDGVHYMHATTYAPLDGVALNTVIRIEDYEHLVIDGHVYVCLYIIDCSVSYRC
jgi:hypothetical protein